jgi:hypothetical protein
MLPAEAAERIAPSPFLRNAGVPTSDVCVN